MKNINKDTVKKILDWTQNCIGLYGPRIAGTDNCLKSAEHIKKGLDEHCTYTRTQSFDIFPSSIFLITKILVSSFLVSSLFYLIGHETVIISLIFLYFGMIYLFMQFVFLNSYFDNFFKKKRGVNVFGIIDPQKKPDKQIIITSHHDSTYICNFLEKRANLYSIRIIFPIIYFMFFTLYITLINFNILDTIQLQYRFVISSIGWFLITPLYFYYSKEGSPGASDNLVSTAMSISIAELIKQNIPLIKTKLIFLSLDAEEIGMRGAKNFIKKNKIFLSDIDTEVINIDTLSNYNDLTLLKTDRNGITKLSKQLANDLLLVAGKLGHKIKIKRFPPGGGGTDAAQFAIKGIKTASIIGIPTNFSKTNFYHTSKDIVKNIEPKAIEAVMNIILNYIYSVDK